MSRSAISLVWLLSLLAAVAFGGWAGRNVAQTKCQADKVAPLVQSIERHDQAAVAGNVVERASVSAEARQESFTRRLTEEVRHAPITTMSLGGAPVPGCDCGLDPFRMYRWRAANRGAQADTSGEPDGTAAGNVAAAGEQLAGRLDDESHRSGGDVPPAARAIQGPGGMAGGDQ